MVWKIGDVELSYPPRRVVQKYKRAIRTMKVVLGKPILLDWGRDTTELTLEGYEDKSNATLLRDTLLSNTQPVYVECDIEDYSGYYVPVSVEIRQRGGRVGLYEYKIVLYRVDDQYATYIQIKS